MKYLFDKQSYLAADMSGKAKRENLFYTVLQIVLFLLAAFSMWEFLYELCNIIGAIVSGCPAQAVVEAVRMAPMILTAFTYVYLNIWLLRAYRAATPEKRVSAWKVNGIITAVVGLCIALYIVIGLITGEYDRLVEGFLSPLFPLDLMLGGVLFIAYGVVSFLYGRKLEKQPSELPCGVKFGFSIVRGIDKVFYFLGFCVALCSFAACVYGIWVLDWTHGAVPFNIFLWLNYFTAFLMAVSYRFVWVNLKEEFKPRAEVLLGIFFLILNILLYAGYTVCVNVWNEAPNLNAYGIVPIDFTASFNAFALVMALNNLLSPLSALIKGLIDGRKSR